MVEMGIARVESQHKPTPCLGGPRLLPRLTRVPRQASQGLPVLARTLRNLTAYESDPNNKTDARDVPTVRLAL